MKKPRNQGYILFYRPVWQQAVFLNDIADLAPERDCID